jgi:hypothetical protein
MVLVCFHVIILEYNVNLMKVAAVWTAHTIIYGGICCLCAELPQYKFLYKMDGITLVEYYCSRHFTEEHKAHIYQ